MRGTPESQREDHHAGEDFEGTHPAGIDPPRSGL
jgi:hypothetical protein